MMRKVFTLPNIIEKKVALKQLFWLSVLSIIGVIFLATPSQALRIEYGYGGEF